MKTLLVICALALASQDILRPLRSQQIPLKRLQRSQEERQSLISLLNIYHNQLKYPSFLQLNTKIPLKNFANTQFVGEVGIGTPPQWLDVIFDTGSANFFINSNLCSSASCLSRPSYNSDNSLSFDGVGFVLEVQFGTGVITGMINQDNISIAGILLKRQRLAEVTAEEGEVFYDGKFSGILGLAKAKHRHK